MSIERWMDKEVGVYIYSGILLIHKKEWIWASSSEVNEPMACYTKWSQREKNKYYILMHIKNSTDEPICRAKIETQI